MDDTIVAISTALGVGAISIIRVSGNESIKIVNKIFKGTNLEQVKSHTINYGYIVENGKIIDEVLVTVMLSPKTFTKEDIIEINCHGSIATVNKILEILLNNGCRLAEPGEFTKRAFLNGRIDLIEAEAVIDLINSRTDQSRELALNHLSGTVSEQIKTLRQEILEIIANIQVNIDYPEYDDIEEMTIEKIKEKMNSIKIKIINIINESKNSKIIKNGIKVSIIGKPNVGKSSILNKLINEEKAIVTNIPGTTRDVVEGTLNIDGLVLNIIDTAGIRKTDDLVESIGVKKSLKLIEDSDLVLFVLNNNEIIEDEEYEILSTLTEKNHIVLINKSDLPKKIKLENIKSEYIINTSVNSNSGFEELKDTIKKIYNLDKIMTKDLTYLSSARSVSILKSILNIINDIEKGITNNEYIDMLEIDIKTIWFKLGEIIGETYEEDLIHQIFEQFCLGK